MSNQEAYEEMCEKAEKYDKLKEAVEKIRVEIVELQKEYQEYGWAYDDALEILDKHTEGLV